MYHHKLPSIINLLVCPFLAFLYPSKCLNHLHERDRENDGKQQFIDMLKKRNYENGILFSE